MAAVMMEMALTQTKAPLNNVVPFFRQLRQRDCGRFDAAIAMLRVHDVVWRAFLDWEGLMTDAEVTIVNAAHDEQAKHRWVREETYRAIAKLYWAVRRRARDAHG
jgi:hypothetical protein